MQYSEFPESLGADTVRLVVVPLAPQATELVSNLENLSEAFKAALPAGTATAPCIPCQHVCTLPIIPAVLSQSTCSEQSIQCLTHFAAAACNHVCIHVCVELLFARHDALTLWHGRQ